MTKEHIERIKRAIAARGSSAVAKDLEISREALARLVGGLPVRRGTETLALSNIAKMNAR